MLLLLGTLLNSRSKNAQMLYPEWRLGQRSKSKRDVY